MLPRGITGAEFFQSENDEQHYFHVKAANHEIVAQSEGYTQHSDAERGYIALLKATEDDHIRLLLERMFRGWQLHEASWDTEKSEYTKDKVDCMVEACDGDQRMGYLIHLFDHWANDIQHVAAHYGIAIERLDDDDCGPIQLVRVDIPPAPCPEAYWEKGEWVVPDIGKDEDTAVSKDA